MSIETLLFGPKQRSTAYSARQLRDKLSRMRVGMASLLPAGTTMAFMRAVKLTREQIIEAIDCELAAFEAFDRLLITVQEQRMQLTARLPLLATAVRDLTLSLAAHVGPAPALRQALGLAPGKKPRRLKPDERLEATAKLRETRKQNRTSEKLRRRRRR
jgi:diacylglycerol kinase family enzyme